MIEIPTSGYIPPGDIDHRIEFNRKINSTVKGTS